MEAHTWLQTKMCRQRLKGSQVSLQTPRQTRMDRHSHRGTKTPQRNQDKDGSQRHPRGQDQPQGEGGKAGHPVCCNPRAGRESRSRQGAPWQHGGTGLGLGARGGGRAGGGGETRGRTGRAAFISRRGRWPPAYAPATALPRAAARAPGRTLPTSACR